MTTIIDDVELIKDLQSLRDLVDEALIAVQRINAVSTLPWTAGQAQFLLRPIAALIDQITPQEEQ